MFDGTLFVSDFFDVGDNPPDTGGGFIPKYRRPTVTPMVVKEDDDDLFLAAWYLYMTNWYKQENK